ncbi:transposase [Parasutterella sp.]|uniref:transposase n=1 Tax=Parasutterella sp. TaxID=2049037 RepID=UPI003522954B
MEAPSSTKNADKKRDPEMRSAKKGSNWHFGMKMHIGVDKATGIIHTVVTTPANVHDVTKADELRRLDDWEVIGDSGYLGMEKRDSADPERVTYTARLTMLASIANMFIGNCFENRTKVSFV